MHPGTGDPASKLAKPFYELKFWIDIKGKPLSAFVIVIHHSSCQSGIILSLVWDQFFKCTCKPAMSFGKHLFLDLSSEDLID